ncbi:MAG: diguanylate cyclase [Sulfuricurvum sp.]|nr:diguanylate cyclase [Sulfuricurvum sp.]
MINTQSESINNHCKVIKHILIIEDSKSLANHLKETIDKGLSFRCDVAYDENSARDMIPRKRYDLIIIDIHLPDSSGNFIGELLRNDHRLIVMTGQDNEECRSKLIALTLVDYVIKSDAKTLTSYLIKTIKRLNENRYTVIGVCDDSKLARTQIANALKLQNIGYIEFEDGQQVLDCINGQDANIDILLTDYEMPKVNGLELIRRIRHTFSEDTLPIIALSASGKNHLLAQFLKIGANDYLPKPFTNEEFLTRLNLTLDYLYILRRHNKLIEELEHISIRDFLTKLYNRHYFFSNIKHITSNAIRNSTPYAIMMIDIDFFKKVNDTYGHHAGDVAIQHLANVLKDTARASDYCFRWGGEEFLILIPTSSHDESYQFAERLRKAVEISSVFVEDEDLTFNITISIGIALGLDKDANHLISKADGMLYEAKLSGRNCVKITD